MKTQKKSPEICFRILGELQRIYCAKNVILKQNCLINTQPYVVCLCVFFLHLRKAFAAINGSVISGLEGNFSLSAAACTCCCEHLSLAFYCVLSCVTASLTSLRLVYKAFLSVKLLLACCEYELFAAIFANKGLVFVQCSNLAKIKNIFTPNVLAPLHKSKCSPSRRAYYLNNLSFFLAL